MRRLTGILFAFTLGWAVLTGVSTANANTIVSLTFDDGNADQMPAVQMLTDHGMQGTFYIIPGRVDRPNSQYMTWANVQTIFAAGNEIGGHTQNHLHLPTLPESQQQSEICGGRDSLLAKGYPQVSFAYPFGDHDSTSEQLVQQCGYLSARGVGGLRDHDEHEPDADTIPPRNPWVLPTPGSIDIDDTLANIKQWIVDAEAVDDDNGSTDAWIPLVIHHLCNPAVTNCADPSGVDDAYITPSDFGSLLDWLQARKSSGTLEKSVAQVMEKTPPASSILCDGAACSSGAYSHGVSATLAATDPGVNAGYRSGVKEIRYTTNGTNPTTSSTLYTSPINVASTTTIKYRAWDNAGNAEAVKTQTIQISGSTDTVKPTSSIQCNGAACSSGFYNASVSATLSGSDTGGSGLKNIRYTTDGTDPTGSSTVYSGPISVAGTTTIKWRAEDNAGNVESIHTQTISVDTVKPTSSILCDGGACSSSYDHAVQATFSGSDSGGSGLNGIRYTTDGSTPNASSPLFIPGTSAAINVGSTKTYKFIAQDKAGNLESPVHSQTITITIDAAPPTSSILCDGAPCQTSYDHPVEATLSATDTGDSGVKEIRYTTDGSEPTSSSAVYTAAIPVSSTTTIEFRAEDNAGNVESPVNSQRIEITFESPPPGGGTVGSAGGTLGSFSSFKSLSNGRGKLTLEVTGPGELEALDGAAGASAARVRTQRIKRTSKSVAEAGRVTLVIKPSKAGKRILRRRGKLRVPVRVIFTPATGSPVAQTFKVKLRRR